MKTDYDPLIRAATLEHLPGVDWRIYKAQLWQESRLDPEAVSPAGAQGIAQFMPDTWQKLAPAGSSPFDPEAAIDAGALYMLYLHGEWSWPRPDVDRWCLALASYNAGLGSILAAQRKSNMASDYASIIARLHDVTGPRNAHETRSYVIKVYHFWVEIVTGAGDGN